MNPDDNKPQNYWQEDPSESVPLAPEQASDTPVAAPSTDEKLVDDDPVNWTAQEYIHLEKGAGWFVLFVIVVLGLISVDIFLLKSYTFSVVVLVAAVAVIIYSRRPPRSLHYALSMKQGLYIGEKLYPFDDFKAFGMIRDGEHFSIMLIPTKRFSPGVSVYFPEEAGEKIVDVLGARLPMENLKLDAIDVLVRKLRL
jgi:hypothetical protein